MIRHIMIGLGGSLFTDVAIRRAVEIAALHKASITGVAVINVERLSRVGPVPLGGDAFAQKMRERQLTVSRDSIRQSEVALEDACRHAGIACRIDRQYADPFERMIALSRYSDLIVFGLRSLFDCDWRSECGLTTEPRESILRLVSSGVRPLVAVSPSYRPVRSALIAYSGSMGSATAMRQFVQLCPWPDLRLGIVHFENQAGHGARLLDEAQTYCKAHGVEVQTAVLTGEARSGLLDYARENDYDLVVLGNGMRSVIMRRLLGDTALELIRTADRPLFLTQ